MSITFPEVPLSSLAPASLYPIGTVMHTTDMGRVRTNGINWVPFFEYTVATLPVASSVPPGHQLYTSDAGQMISDGTAWTGGSILSLSGGSSSSNTSQLQARINVARLSNGGSGKVQIASGSYRVDSTITLYAGDVQLICDLGVRWLGENCGTNPVFSIQRYAYGTTPAKVMTGGLIQAYNAGIQNENNATAGAGHSVFRANSVAFKFDGLSGVHCSDIVIENVLAYDFDLSTDYTDNCYNHTYVDCRFRGNKGACINQLRANSYEAMRWMRCQFSACNYPFYLDMTTPGAGTLGLGSGSAGGSLFLIDCISDYYGIQGFYRGCNPDTSLCNNSLLIQGGHMETDHNASGTGARIDFSGNLALSGITFYEQGNTPASIVRQRVRHRLSYSNVTIIHGNPVALSELWNTLDSSSSSVTDPTVRYVSGRGLWRNDIASTPVLKDSTGVVMCASAFGDNGFVRNGDSDTVSLDGSQIYNYMGSRIIMQGSGGAMTVNLPTTELAGNFAAPIEFVLQTTAAVTFVRGSLPMYVAAVNSASKAYTGRGTRVWLNKTASQWELFASAAA